jgi:hypothetical protein
VELFTGANGLPTVRTARQSDYSAGDAGQRYMSMGKIS